MTLTGTLRSILSAPARSLRARIVASFAGLALVVLVAVALGVTLIQRRSLKENALTLRGEKKA